MAYCYFCTAGQNVFVFPKFPLSPLLLSEPVIRVIPFPFYPPSHLCKSDIMLHTFQNLPLTQFPANQQGVSNAQKTVLRSSCQAAEEEEEEEEEEEIELWECVGRNGIAKQNEYVSPLGPHHVHTITVKMQKSFFRHRKLGHEIYLCELSFFRFTNHHSRMQLILKKLCWRRSPGSFLLRGFFLLSSLFNCSPSFYGKPAQGQFIESSDRHDQKIPR